MEPVIIRIRRYLKFIFSKKIHIDVTQQVLELFDRERQKGCSQRENLYWGSGDRNVGRAVLNAVSRASLAIRQQCNTPISLNEAATIVEKIRENEYDPDDEYGYGLATFDALSRGLRDIAREAGENAVLRPTALF